MLATGADVMLSGGLRHLDPKSTNDKVKLINGDMTQGDVYLKSKRKDDRNLLTEAEKAATNWRLTATC